MADDRGPLLAIGYRLEPVRRNAERDQHGLHRVGAAGAQGKVILPRAALVGVPLDREGPGRAGGDRPGEAFDPRPHVGAHCPAIGVEQDRLAGEPVIGQRTQFATPHSTFANAAATANTGIAAFASGTAFAGRRIRAG